MGLGGSEIYQGSGREWTYTPATIQILTKKPTPLLHSLWIKEMNYISVSIVFKVLYNRPGASMVVSVPYVSMN